MRREFFNYALRSNKLRTMKYMLGHQRTDDPGLRRQGRRFRCDHSYRRPSHGHTGKGARTKTGYAATQVGFGAKKNRRSTRRKQVRRSAYFVNPAESARRALRKRAGLSIFPFSRQAMSSRFPRYRRARGSKVWSNGTVSTAAPAVTDRRTESVLPAPSAAADARAAVS